MGLMICCVDRSYKHAAATALGAVIFGVIPEPPVRVAAPTLRTGSDGEGPPQLELGIRKLILTACSYVDGSEGDPIGKPGSQVFRCKIVMRPRR
jgi:hypothetical protein